MTSMQFSIGFCQRRTGVLLAGLLVGAAMPALQGCAVVTVASTVTSVAVGTAGLAASAVIGTARIAGSAVGAAADAVLPATGK